MADYGTKKGEICGRQRCNGLIVEHKSPDYTYCTACGWKSPFAPSKEGAAYLFAAAMSSGLAIPQPAKRAMIAIPDGTEHLRQAMQFLVERQGREFQWLDAYTQVGSWLEGNKGNGLLMFGQPGLGKSLLTRHVIPALLSQFTPYKPKVVDFNAINGQIDELCGIRCLCLDDIGLEGESVLYGNRRCAFGEIMDAMEKNGNLVVVSTNLGPKDLLRDYGPRVYDRIMATMTRVPFEGKSFRK